MSKRHQAIIALASNYEAEKNLFEAKRYLEQILFDIHYSECKGSPAFGDKSKGYYYNQLLFCTTDLSVEQLIEVLKNTETKMGRTPEIREQGVVNIDLDLMLYDEQHYHLRDWDRPYIQCLLPQP